MAVLVAKSVFGAGPYSTTHGKMLRMVGRNRPISEFCIKKASGRYRDQHGVVRASAAPPYMPKSFLEAYHPGGNSVCFAIQTAHLMGCSPIYLLAFTLQSGTGYHFGLDNPVTRKRSFYVPDIPLAWLSWYAKTYPGRVQLLPGWDGPIYEVLDEARFEADELPNSGRDQPDAAGGDVSRSE